MNKQHTKPCHDCPFRREGFADGGSMPEVYVGQAMGPFLLSCHNSPGYYEDRRSTKHAQCAGAAIFRANIQRSELMPPKLLRLPQDKEAVFADAAELIAAHSGCSLHTAKMELAIIPPEIMMREEMKKSAVKEVNYGH